MFTSSCANASVGQTSALPDFHSIIQANEQQYVELEKELSAINQKMEETKLALAALPKQVTAARDNLSNAKSERSSLAGICRHLQQGIETKRSTNAMLAQQVSYNKEDVEELERMATAARHKFLKECENLNEELTKLRNQYKTT